MFRAEYGLGHKLLQNLEESVGPTTTRRRAFLELLLDRMIVDLRFDVHARGRFATC